MVGMCDTECECSSLFPPDTYRKIMNWRQHLIFSPELPPISHEAEDLIKRYLTIITDIAYQICFFIGGVGGYNIMSLAHSSIHIRLVIDNPSADPLYYTLVVIMTDFCFQVGV